MQKPLRLLRALRGLVLACNDYMSLISNADLQTRVTLLEQIVHRQRRIINSLGIGLVALMLIAGASTSHDVLRARKLEIVDVQGRVSASIQTHGSGGGMLHLFGSDNMPLASISAANGGVLKLRGSAGDELVQIGKAPFGPAGVMSIRNAEGQVAIFVTTDIDGNGYIGASGAFGVGKAFLPHPYQRLGAGPPTVP